MAPVPALYFSIAPSKLQKLQKRCLAIAAPEALWKHELFLLGFEAAIWHFRGATTCLLLGLRSCYLARFQHPLKALQALKPSQQLSTAFRCFAMRPLAAPQTVSVRLRSCYLALPKRHNLFLLGLRSCYLALPRRHNLFLLGLRNCHLARFQHPLKALKPSKPS